MALTKEQVKPFVKRFLTLRPSRETLEMGGKASDVRDEMTDALIAFTRSEDHAERVTRQIMDGSDFMPTRSQIRATADSVPVTIKPSSRPICRACDGAGFISVWKLVTYKGNSFNIERSEALPEYNYEMAMEFARKLPDNQTVLSAARACACLAPTHKILTGERR